MKKTKTSTLLSVVTASIIAGSAIAATPNLTDSNGDGVISAEEITTARAAAKATALSEYDANGDGELSRMERRAMKDARYAEMVAQFDADGDGEISREERRTARDARRAAIDAQLDVNQDGVVSDEEAAGYEQVREERGNKKHGKKCGHKKDRNAEQSDSV